MDAPSNPAATPERRSYGEQLRILVVDDDPDTVNTLAFILRDEGYVVQPVYSGDEALSVVRVFRPDVITAANRGTLERPWELWKQAAMRDLAGRRTRG